MTTSYAGGKSEDPNAYDRMFTVDEDKEQLERFWQECIAESCQALMRVLEEANNEDEQFKLKLQVSNSFDDSLKPSMALSIRSYFINSIVGKWFAFTNKADVESYIKTAAIFLDDIKRKSFYKRMPTRPLYK